MTYDYDLFVIGGGSGGVRCARIAAGHGARVAIAEERHWGGTCVNVGCVPKKLMVMASEYRGAAEDSRGFGWDIAPGRHDWSTLIAHKNDEITRLNAIYRRLLDGAGVVMFDDRAIFLDPHTLDVGGRRITAERIVIAVGGRPLKLEMAGGEHCIVSDDAFFLPERPRRVVTIGGGYIAVEFAGIFAGLGSAVEMVMRGDLPLRGFDQDLRGGLVDALESNGIRLHRGARIQSITAEGGIKRVTLGDGTVLEADLVFAAIGRAPLVDGLGLERAGVRITGFGAVAVDGLWCTSVPHIYAIGDVTDRMNLTPVAIAEGHSLADTLFGPGRRSWEFERVATAVFSSPPIATVGLTEDEAAMRGPADVYMTRFTPMRHALSGRRRQSMMKLIVDQMTQVVVGAHMIGEDAPEIIQGLSIAMNCGAKKADFDRTIGIHPTAAEEFVTLRTRARVAESPLGPVRVVPVAPEQDAQSTGAEEIGAAEAGLGA